MEPERLDGDETLVFGVPCQIDARHGAVAERADGSVAPGECDLELFEDEVSQGVPPVNGAPIGKPPRRETQGLAR